MPWEVAKRGGRFCVVKKDSGTVVTCHGSRAKATRQLRALYASESTTAAATWDGVLAGAAWDESKHARVPAGTANKERDEREGGQFAPKGPIGTFSPKGVQMGLGKPERREQLELTGLPVGLGVPTATQEEARARLEADLKAYLDSREISIRVPAAVLSQIVEDGEFYNQHHVDTGGVGGGWDRAPTGEARILGFPEDTPGDQLPIYGYAGRDNEYTLHYGEVRVILKDSVKDRATFTLGDTLVVGNLIPSPMRDPSWMSAVNAFEEMSEAASLEPGEHRYHGSEAAFEEPDPDALESALDGGTIPYVEVQIYGGVKLQDIQAIEVPDMEYWDEIEPVSGLPLVPDQDALRLAMDAADEAGIRSYTAEPPGDYSGEWA